MVLSSCSLGRLSKKSPPRAKDKTWYDFSEKEGIIYHRKCKKKSGEDRKCTITEIDINKEWKFFEYGQFIVVPEAYCF